MYNFLQLILLGKKHCLSFYTDTGNLWEKHQNNCFYARLENLEYFSSALMQPGFQRDLRVSAALPVQVTSYLRYLGVCVCVCLKWVKGSWLPEEGVWFLACLLALTERASDNPHWKHLPCS